MSNISAHMVKELRERSGAGMMECKKALVENNADIDAAMEWLRKSGLAKADKKASRIAAEGRIVAAQTAGKAVLVEINCETDFVGKDASFLKFSDAVADVALKSGAADIDALKAAAYAGGGTVEEAAKALIATIGEKIDVRRMARVESTGVIGNYIHGGRIGVLVALTGGSEELAKGIAMHVAAMNPAHIRAEDPQDRVRSDPARPGLRARHQHDRGRRAEEGRRGRGFGGAPGRRRGHREGGRGFRRRSDEAGGFEVTVIPDW